MVPRIPGLNTTLFGAVLAGTTSLSGGQLKFPATQNASADANTLDDYEEGTWTPSVGGTATYTVQNGRYTKIGNLVAIAMDLQINSIGSGSAVAISGLPFTAVMNSGLAVVDFASVATNVTALMARIAGSGTTIDLRSTTAAQATAGTSNILGNGARVMACGIYLI